MSPPIRDGSGNSIGSIRLGDGSEISEVRTGAGDVLFSSLPVAASDLVAWYPFRAGTGEDITTGNSNFGDTTDYSATVNGATFQASGGVTDIRTGVNSGAFDFDGTDDTLDLGTVADSDQSFTVMTWIEPDTVTKGFMRILTKRDGQSGTDGSFILLVNSNQALRFFVQNNGNPFNAEDNAVTLSANTYTHIAGRYDFQSGTTTAFVNGQPTATASPGQLPANSSQPWRIGEDNPVGNAEFLDGAVDGTRIYTAALSDSQVNQIYLNTEP